ncbi:MAG: hypothetical protein ACKO39_11715, partial [Chthoniobacterales bacterium]
TDWSNRKLSAAPSVPGLPAAPKRAKRGAEGRRRPQKANRPSRQLDLRGRAIFFAIALLAVLLTIGILLLLMQI